MKMQFYGSLLLTLSLVSLIRCNKLAIDDDAQTLCKKYKMMCKTGKICAVQSFEWPKNITIPVCIPLSFVPVRNLICQLPPDTGRCHARYIRWYYNIHAQECTHFQYGGCEGNQNNFMTKRECEGTCLSTPSIRLSEGGNSALVQHSAGTSSLHVTQNVSKYEALNSATDSDDVADRHQIANNRHNKMRADEAASTRTRRRLDKVKEKERRRRARRKEKKRLRKLRKQQIKRAKNNKKEDNGKKNVNKKPIKTETQVVKQTAPLPKNETIDIKKQTNEVTQDTKSIIANEIQGDTAVHKRKERKRNKRRERNKSRKGHDVETREVRYNSRRTYLELKEAPQSVKMFSILDHGRGPFIQKNAVVHS